MAAKFLLCLFRDLSSDENQELSKHFKRIVSFDGDIHTQKVNLDVDWANIDCIIADLRVDADVTFVESIFKDWKGKGFPICVVKGSFVSGFSKLVSSLVPTSVIEEIPTNVSDDATFCKLLVKSALPKTSSGFKYLLMKALKLLSCILESKAKN